MYGCSVGDSHPLDKIGFQAGGIHGPGDGLAAAMHDYRVDPDRLKENHIPSHAIAHESIGRVHKTATVFNDKRRTIESLDVRQRFVESGRFGNEVLQREKDLRWRGTKFSGRWMNHERIQLAH